MINIAYHMHTKEQEPFFWGIRSAEELFSALYEKNIQVMGIADKNSVKAIKRLKDKSLEKKLGVYIPVSAEVVMRDESELMVVFDKLDEDIEKMINNGSRLSYLDIARYTKSRGGKVILQHMFSPVAGIGLERGWDLYGRGLVDAVEWNLQQDNILMKKKNIQAVDFANKFNLPVIYSNDNYFGEVKAVMKVDSANPEEAFWKIFDGKFEVEIGKPSLYNRASHFYHGFKFQPRHTLGILVQ